jgi:peptidyl-prolyl cis-trans isomerase C
MKKTVILLSLIFLLSACNFPAGSQDNTPVPTPETPIPTVEKTAIPSPTPTEEIFYVAFVNSEGILLDSFQISYNQYLEALKEGAELPSGELEIQMAVIDDLINRLLLSQAAREAGFTATDEIVAERISDLESEIGDSSTLDQWLLEQGYTRESFSIELSIEIEAAWQRKEIIKNVPTTAEQVRARQVHFYDPYLANRAYGQLLDGASFETIAANNDPQGFGYLGWFPRNYLLIPKIEEAAFALQTGEYSDLIVTESGYFLVEVLEREEDRRLQYDALLTLQALALKEWLLENYAGADIEILGQ